MDCVLENLESIFSILESIAVVVGLIGVYIVYCQRKEQKSERQFQYVKDFSSSIMGDPDMAAFIHMIERKDGIGFENGVFKPAENERVVDYALCRLSNYVVLRKNELADSKDFQFIDYVLKQTLENVEIKAYLSYMLDVVQGDKSVHPYNQLLDYKIKD